MDMPLEQLESYEGKTPRPGDFDEYWERAVEEMRGVDPQLCITRAEFQAPTVDCYEMYFTGVNGARIHVKHLRPRQIKGKIPAVLQFHGYGDDCGSWVSDRLAYAASGYAVFAMDVRGQGGLSEDVSRVKGDTVHGHVIMGLEEENPHKLLYRDIFLDTAQLAGLVLGMDFVDETKVYAIGGSQGGALTVACAALEPRIAKAAISYPFLSDYKRAWELDLPTRAYEGIKYYFRKFDPRHEREDEIFAKLGYIDVQNLAPRIKAEVIMFTGLCDNACPPSTQYAVYNKMTCKKRHILYPDYGHEYLKDADEITFRFLTDD